MNKDVLFSKENWAPEKDTKTNKHTEKLMTL